MKVQVIALLMIVMLTITIARQSSTNKNEKIPKAALNSTRTDSQIHPTIKTHNIILVPEIKCPDNQQRDSNGVCRPYLAK